MTDPLKSELNAEQRGSRTFCINDLVDGSTFHTQQVVQDVIPVIIFIVFFVVAFLQAFGYSGLQSRESQLVG